MDSSSDGQKSSCTSNSVSSSRSKTDPAWAHFKEDLGNDGKKVGLVCIAIMCGRVEESIE